LTKTVKYTEKSDFLLARHCIFSYERMYTQTSNRYDTNRTASSGSALQKQFALETLERYSGSKITDFQPFILLTNFPRYVDYFAKKHKCEIIEGAMFKVCHSKKNKITILDFKIGSPAAALVVDLCAFFSPAF
jgi:hypothetical protein